MCYSSALTTGVGNGTGMDVNLDDTANAVIAVKRWHQAIP
jgi:hypothetical protein